MPLITESGRAETEMFQRNTNQFIMCKGPNLQNPSRIHDYIRRRIYFTGLR